MLPASVNAPAEFARRLEARRGEVEQTILARLRGLTDLTGKEDGAIGLRPAAEAALDYGLSAIGDGEESAAPPPPVLLLRARQAARGGVGLDVVLRRYFAGLAVLGDFLMEEFERARISIAELRRAQRVQAAMFDRLVDAVAREYKREAEGAVSMSADQRRSRYVERLLAGEPIDAADLAYDLEEWHVGLIATGAAADGALRKLAAGLDRRLLLVHRPEGIIWAWLGGRSELDPATAVEQVAMGDIRIAVGESGHGGAGWRLSHQQAEAAWLVAQRRQPAVTRYADVALLASALRDELLTTSLRCLYLEPLRSERDGGKTLRKTLRAYFEAARNAASAAAALGVSRQTVNARLRLTEERLGRPLSSCATDLETALRVSELSEACLPLAPASPR